MPPMGKIGHAVLPFHRQPKTTKSSLKPAQHAIVPQCDYCHSRTISSLNPSRWPWPRRACWGFADDFVVFFPNTYLGRGAITGELRDDFVVFFSTLRDCLDASRTISSFYRPCRSVFSFSICITNCSREPKKRTAQRRWPRGETEAPWRDVERFWKVNGIPNNQKEYNSSGCS